MNISILKNKLDKIKQMDKIKCNYQHTSKVGYTIEDLLGLERNNFKKPDFMGIEIKTRSTHSKPFITLFNLTPTSKENVIKYIQGRYGYPDKKNPIYKNFNVSVFGNKFHSTIWNKFKLIVAENYLKLKILDRSHLEIDDSVYWSRLSLNQSIQDKLNYLCIIKTVNTKEGDNYYFRISSFKIYRLKDLDCFYRLIREGYIRVTFKIGTFKKGERTGQTHDRGTGFDINSFHIDKLFTEVARDGK
jgi:hypothetical protein